MFTPQNSRRVLSFATLIALALALSTRASATAVVSESFADGTRSGQSTSLPLTSLDWRLGPANATSEVSANFWGLTPSANTILVGHFHPVTLELGETLTVSFSYRHGASPTSTSFRIGLLNSNASRLNTDTTDTAPPAFAAATGYVVFTGLGTSTGTGGYTVRENTGTGANLFASAENAPLSGTNDKGPGATAANTLYTGSITLTREALASLRVNTSFNGAANTGVDTSPVETLDTLALFITAASGKFELGNVSVTTTGTVSTPVQPAPRVLAIDRRGGAAFASIAQAVANGLNPGDTLRLAPGSGPYRETVFLSSSGTVEAPIVFDAQGEIITGFDPLLGFQTVNGVTTCDLTAYWTSGRAPQGFSKVNGRWAAISVPSGAAQPMPFVLTYKGERLVQSTTVRTTPPAGSAPGTLGKLGQLTRHATLSDDGNTLTLLPGTSADDWEISVRDFVIRVYDTSHQTYRNLKASGSLNDGINLHGDGENLRFENVEGFHNLDEGFSAHDTITCEIHGGVFYRNDNGLVNVNNSVLTATDVLCHGNFGYGVSFKDTSIATIDHLRTARNGVRDLALYNQSVTTLRHVEVSGGGWTKKPLLSCTETGALSTYVGLEVATAAGARLLGDAPTISASIAPIAIDTDSAGTSLEVFFHCPADARSQLQSSNDLVTWQAAGPILSDDLLHRWTEPLAPRRFYRVVLW